MYQFFLAVVYLFTAAMNLKTAVLNRLGREEKSSMNSAGRVRRGHPKHLRKD